LGVGGGGSYAAYSVVFVVVEGCDGEHFVEELGVGRHFGGGLVWYGGEVAKARSCGDGLEISQGMGRSGPMFFRHPSMMPEVLALGRVLLTR